MPGPEREEGEGVLEVGVISRDGTDRQRADYRAWPLTFGELRVTAAVAAASAGRAGSASVGLRDNPSLPRCDTPLPHGQCSLSTAS